MSKSLFTRFSPLNGYSFIKKLSKNFGHKLLWLIVSIHAGSKGGAYTFSVFFQLPYYREAGHTAQTQQLMYSISFIPWSIKGFFGIMSDLFPLFGYQKKWYCIIVTLLGGPSCLVLAFIPWDIVYTHPYIPSLLFFFIFLETAVLDLLVEGKYAEQMKKVPETKGDIVTFSWLCSLTGEIIPAVLVGPISDRTDSRILFYIFFPFALQPLIPLFMGYLIEDKVLDYCKSNKIDFEKFKKQFNLILITTLQSLASITTLIFAIWGNSTSQSAYSLGSGLILCFVSFFLLPTITAKFNLYDFLVFSFYANLRGALEYFYVAEESCVPGGPKFDYTFIRTYGHIVSVCSQIIGLFVFQVVLSHWKFRHIFWITTLLRILASFSDIILINRWNLRVGIPDFVFYLLGYSVVYNLTYTLDFLPCNIMLAKLCPKSVESTMSALLAGFMNFGTNVSNVLGIFLMDIFRIQTVRENGLECNFTNSSWMILVGHGLLPALTMPLVFFLIPNTYISDPLVDIEHKMLKSEPQTSQ